VLRLLARLFDRLEHAWESPWAHRAIATTLVAVFLGALGVAELGALGIVPAPEGFAWTIKLAFNLLLVIEVIGLVFSLAESVSISLGKQFEILSLILLRSAFKEFVRLGGSLEWTVARATILNVVSDAVGGLAIFLALGFFYRLQLHRPICTDEEEMASFIAMKKSLALVLLGVFVGTAIAMGERTFSGEGFHAIFEHFYSVLVFSDVLLVLIALRYSSTYAVVFRNSGFAVATLLMRLSLAAPPFWNSVLGLGAVVFAIALTISYNVFLRNARQAT